MRNPERINKVQELIGKIWKKNPDLRLCQLIGNCFEPTDLYHVKDDILVKALKKYYEKDLRKLKLMNLGKKERKLLLTALNFDINNLKCQFCGKKTTYDKCGIMPPIETKEQATILCESILCITEYIAKVEG